MTAAVWRRSANFLACAGIGGCVAFGFAASYTTVAELVNHHVLRYWGVSEWSPLALLVLVVYGFVGGSRRRREDRIVRRWCFAAVVIVVASSVHWLLHAPDQRKWITAILGASALVVGPRLFATFSARAASNRDSIGEWVAFLAGMWTAIGATELQWLWLPRVDGPELPLVGAMVTGILIANPRIAPRASPAHTTSATAGAERTLGWFELLALGTVGELVTAAVGECTSAPVLRVHDARLLHTKCLLAAIGALCTLARPPRDDRAAFRRIDVAVALCAAQFAVLAFLQWDGPHEWSVSIREWWGLPPRDTHVRDIVIVATTVGASSIALGVVLATLPWIVRPGSNAIGVLASTWIVAFAAMSIAIWILGSHGEQQPRVPKSPSTTCLLAALSCVTLVLWGLLRSRRVAGAAR